MSDEANHGLPVVVRSAVQPKSSYSDYKDDLRFDFWYSCAYCTISEIEGRGIAFEIDHYDPAEHFQHLRNEYTNLMWSCDRCNRTKGDEYPTDTMKQRGMRFLRPDMDDPDEHFELRNVTELHPKTPIGEYSIETIRLNRYQLLKLREIRNRIYESAEAIANGIRALKRQNIDRFPTEIRWKVLELKTKLENEGERSSVEEALRQFNRSEFLDVDPEKKKQNARRREYLKRQKTLLPLE